MLNSIVGFLGNGAGGAAGSYESIATQTLGTAAANVTFSSIPSTYKHLQLRFMASCGYGSINNTDITYNLNSDTTATNYYSHRLFGAGTSANAAAANNTFLTYGLDTPTSTSTYGVCIIDLIDYADTSKYKTTRTFVGYDTNSTTGIVGLTSSLWKNTAAVDTIKLTASDGNWTVGSTFALYGIKGA